MTDVSTHLMFQDGTAREAVEGYVELIPNSTITDVIGPDGPGQTIRFTLASRPFIAFDSPIAHDFDFTPSMSIFLTCDTPNEVDELFGKLSSDGSVMMPLDDYGFSRRFGWCTDRHASRGKLDALESAPPGWSIAAAEVVKSTYTFGYDATVLPNIRHICRAVSYGSPRVPRIGIEPTYLQGRSRPVWAFNTRIDKRERL